MSASADSGRGDSPVFDDLLDEALLNADVASNWRADRSALVQVDGRCPGGRRPSQCCRQLQGLCRAGWLSTELTYADLQAAGCPCGRSIRAGCSSLRARREIAIKVSGQQDGSFDSGDALFFYGRAPRSRYHRAQRLLAALWGSGGTPDGTPPDHSGQDASGCAVDQGALGRGSALRSIVRGDRRRSLVCGGSAPWKAGAGPRGSDGSGPGGSGQHAGSSDGLYVQPGREPRPSPGRPGQWAFDGGSALGWQGRGCTQRAGRRGPAQDRRQ